MRNDKLLEHNLLLMGKVDYDKPCMFHWNSMEGRLGYSDDEIEFMRMSRY